MSFLSTTGFFRNMVSDNKAGSRKSEARSSLNPAFSGTWFLTIKPEVRSTKHEAGLNPAFSGTWFLTKEFPHFTSILIILFIFEF
jgi:hypothetical protein